MTYNKFKKLQDKVHVEIEVTQADGRNWEGEENSKEEFQSLYKNRKVTGRLQQIIMERGGSITSL